MRLYHSGLSLKVIRKYRELYPDRRLNALLTFGIPNADSFDLQNSFRKLIGSLILDSGTYSLNKRKAKIKNINLSGYLLYLKEFGSSFDFCFNFDEEWSKGGSEVNQDNQYLLEKEGFKPVPVIHNIYGDEVQYYIGQGYKMIAIGSSEIVGKNAIGWIVDRLHRKNIKVHLFGTSQAAYLADIPVFSCDSSSWRQVAARDYIMFRNIHSGSTDSIRVETVIPTRGQKWNRFKLYKHRVELEQYLWDELKMEYKDLLGYDGLVNRQVVNTHFLVEMERKITENHLNHGWQF